jgi:hypothetical protein
MTIKINEKDFVLPGEDHLIMPAVLAAPAAPQTAAAWVPRPEAPRLIHGGSGGPARKAAEHTAELERLRRIEANYERDKAMLRQDRALARSASHDVGHAEGFVGHDLTRQEIDSMTGEYQRMVAAYMAQKLC